MKQFLKDILKFIVGIIFLLFWFPVLLVSDSVFEWWNYISNVSRFGAGVIGAYAIFIWVIDKLGFSEKE